MKIAIKEYKSYGKLLGGCVYAGFPIDVDIRVCFAESIFMELNMKMIIKESLEYQIIANWGSDTVDMTWVDYKYSYSKESMKQLLDNINYNNLGLLGVSIEEDIMEDLPLLVINNLNVHITNENRKNIYDFLNNFTAKIKELYEEINKYYDDHEQFIKQLQ